jgi:hypothetical protein
MKNTLILTYAGFLGWNNGTIGNQGAYGFYWASSPNGDYGYYVDLSTGGIDPNQDVMRANGNSIRCIKN